MSYNVREHIDLLMQNYQLSRNLQGLLAILFNHMVTSCINSQSLLLRYALYSL